MELAPPIPGAAKIARIRELAARARRAACRPAAAAEEAARHLWDSEYWWYELAARAEVPRMLWHCTVEGIQSPAVVAVREFYDEGPADGDDDLDYGRCLGLLGDVGIGKTWAVVAGVRYDGADEAWFLTFPAMLRQLLDPMRRAETSARLREAEPLVIDDFGAGAAFKEGSFLEGLVEELFVERELRRAWTMFTSNLREEALLEWVGDRVADRLLGPWGRLVEVGGENLRRRRPRA
ncbi:MAG TPA: hypothetical protein VL086_09145 [Candidatus Nitrosotalea sp.]|nr:hypothetical protein [Candidatus Nitrosotalea sp.]